MASLRDNSKIYPLFRQLMVVSFYLSFLHLRLTQKHDLYRSNKALTSYRAVINFSLFYLRLFDFSLIIIKYRVSSSNVFCDSFVFIHISILVLIVLNYGDIMMALKS